MRVIKVLENFMEVLKTVQVNIVSLEAIGNTPNAFKGDAPFGVWLNTWWQFDYIYKIHYKSCIVNIYQRYVDITSDCDHCYCRIYFGDI